MGVSVLEADQLSGVEGRRPWLIWRDGKHSTAFLLGLVILLSTTLALGLAYARRPFCDEAWFASPSYNLAKYGTLKTTVLDPHGFVFAPLVQDLDKYTFWVMPGYLLVQAAWYKIFGFGLQSMRAISITFGIVAILALFSIVRRTTGDRMIALLAALLLGTEQHFALSAAMGRMDIMCATLSLLAVAVYLKLREDSLRKALIVSAAILAVGVFTHPNAVIGVATVGGLVLWLDRHRLRIGDLILAALPVTLFAGLWGLYVLQSPEAFASQMKAQAAIPHRFELPLNPFAAVWRELEERYFTRYGIRAPAPLGVLRIVFFTYAAALIAVLVVPGLRKLKASKVLLLIFAMNFAFLTCLQKNFYYLIYILPAIAGLVALTLHRIWERPQVGRFHIPKLAVVGLVFAVVGLNVGMTGSRVVHNNYSRYSAAVETVKAHLGPGDLVIGSGELAFDLGFEGRITDDARLGFTSGKRPEFIVLEAFYGIMWLNWFRRYEPDTAIYMENLIANDYELILDQARDDYKTYGMMDAPYRVYQRRVQSEE